jgi:hypothetical protein
MILTQANALTYQTGQDTVVRAQFIKNATLANTEDTNFRAVNNNWPTFAFAHTITVGATVSTPVKFTIGRVRDPAIEYILAGNVHQKRSSYWWSTYTTVAALVRFTILACSKINRYSNRYRILFTRTRLLWLPQMPLMRRCKRTRPPKSRPHTRRLRLWQFGR